jgi:hypothetical protein
MSRSVEISASLTLVNEKGERILLHADDHLITVELPDASIGRSAIKQLPGRRQREKLVGYLQRSLRLAESELELRMSQRRIAQLTPDSRPNIWSWMLGLGALKIEIIPLLLAVLKVGR